MKRYLRQGLVWVLPLIAGLGCGKTATVGSEVRSGEAQSPSDLAPLPVVIFHSEPELAYLVARLERDPYVWGPFPGIGRLEGVLADTIEVWLTADMRSLLTIGLGRSEEWVAGTADAARQRIGLRAEPASPNSGVRGTLRHELAHLAIYRATGGNAPRWMSEGYAQLAAGQWDTGEAWRLRVAFFRQTQSPLRSEALRFRGRGADARLDYLLSYTAVDWLYAQGGEAGLERLFGSLRSGERFDRSLRSVYGVTEAQFEQRWRRQVLDRYGWLYVFSRAALFWLGLSVFLLLVVGRRLRRDRIRLEEMREAERLHEAAADFVDGSTA